MITPALYLLSSDYRLRLKYRRAIYLLPMARYCKGKGLDIKELMAGHTKKYPLRCHRCPEYYRLNQALGEACYYNPKCGRGY